MKPHMRAFGGRGTGPACAVVTPVGPGHEELSISAAASVRRAWSRSPGPFKELLLIPVDDGEGRLGRSRARNEGVREAGRRGADWLFFLDADDLLAEEAFSIAEPHLERHDALWGAISSFSEGEAPHLRPGQLGESADLREILLGDPFLTLQMGHFVRTSVALEIPFDEQLDVGEDFDYYLRVWRRYRCRKLDAPLFHNRRGRHSTGPRSGDGGTWRRAVRGVLAFHARQLELTTQVSVGASSIAIPVDDPLAEWQRDLLRGRVPLGRELERLRRDLGGGSLAAVGPAGPALAALLPATAGPEVPLLAREDADGRWSAWLARTVPGARLIEPNAETLCQELDRRPEIEGLVLDDVGRGLAWLSALKAPIGRRPLRILLTLVPREMPRVRAEIVGLGLTPFELFSGAGLQRLLLRSPAAGR